MKIDVGIVSSPGCSKTMRGLRRSPRTSQNFAPKARAPCDHFANASLSVQWGSIPQCSNSFRLMHPFAPSFRQKSNLSSLDTTATGVAPKSFAIWIAMDPSPPDPPQTSTTSPFSPVCGGQAAGRPYVVVVDSRRHHEHKGLPRLQLRRRLDFLHLERLDRLPEPLRPDHLRIHRRRHFADWRNLADLVDLFYADHERLLELGGPPSRTTLTLSRRPALGNSSGPASRWRVRLRRGQRSRNRPRPVRPEEPAGGGREGRWRRLEGSNGATTRRPRQTKPTEPR